jgi:hypothetical protein
MPLTFLDNEYLAAPTLMNLRGLRPRDIGVFPYGTPAYLAFSTGCIRHLFER